MMVVSIRIKGKHIAGILIGAANVRQHFPRRTAAVDIHLGQLVIQCPLPPQFWDDSPEIADPRLCDWLEFKRLLLGSPQTPFQLELSPLGSAVFRLSPVPVQATQPVPAVQTIPALAPLLPLPPASVRVRSLRAPAAAHGLVTRLAG